MDKKEFISHHPEDATALLCICGNTPWAQGFLSCDHEGREIEVIEKFGPLYCCDACGRIIDADTLAVIGRTGNEDAVGVGV